ncbi:glycosyltransferase family 4 protein [Winogradskyella alexanderae]|uniref:Glycosyltransferase family 4 protein n=1 Tax=Winogradskyella alexanderae TaxID=2877123 RepID=A0ABS7XPN0_9FLAO|nr:glycosyltransferase family 4 protein [Winogradskyella alexanderae]MCA0131974.1 glycosyltransferase family 4 protein [Winogradskyella alexanderae]
MDAEVILISGLALPFHKVASWTNMYGYLLEKKKHPFNYIICPEPEVKSPHIKYQFLRKVSVFDKVKNKLPSQSSHGNYIEAIDKIIEPNKKYIIQIIDNSGIVIPIDRYLNEKHNRADFYIQYYFQGFAPIVSRKKGKSFLYAIDEFFFLSHLSYKAYLEFYDDCPFKARILYNAVELNKFYTVDENERNSLRTNLDIEKDDILFMWCSQDRPKKGLHIALEAFEKVHSKNKNTKLIVVGINRAINQNGVINIGRVPNIELAKYYQMSDIYLFPTLWKEGFGIVLAEAMHCGCYIIASEQGSVKEVLGNGKYGVLIEYPNLVNEWVIAMQNAIEEISQKGNIFRDKVPKDLYSLDKWCEQMNAIVHEAKQKLKD